MHYTHIDTSLFLGDAKNALGIEVAELKKVVGDKVLMSVLIDKRCKVSFLFLTRA